MEQIKCKSKSNSVVNLTTINSKQKSSSLPNLNSNSSTIDDCCSCSPCSSKPLITLTSSASNDNCTRHTKVIPAILQKTWNKIKSMNKKRPSNCNSAPPTPSSLSKFDFEDEDIIAVSEASSVQHSGGPGGPPGSSDLLVEEVEADPVQENYYKLQKRLSEELHQGQLHQIGKTIIGGGGGKSSYNINGEFKKKLQQWEMWKVSCGKVTYTEEELKLILPEDFSRKLKEWENIRSGSPSANTNVKIEKQIQWLERQLEKVEQEKSKLENQMRKYLEKEARLEKMREALKNYPREQVLIKTPTAEGVAAGVDEKFTKKLYEWEEMRGIPAEDGSMALLNPKYYHQFGGSSHSSEPPDLHHLVEQEDIPEISQDDQEPEPNTPDTSSSLESINQASGSNTSSADFYQKSRRRSSDAVSTPLSARSPSLSAFTSDDEDAGLLKTVEEEDAEEKSEHPPNPVVRVNQILVMEEDDEEPGTSHCPTNVIVPTKRTLLKPIETEQQSSTAAPESSESVNANATVESPSTCSTPELKDLRSPSLVKCAGISNNYNSNSSTNPVPPAPIAVQSPSSSEPTTSETTSANVSTLTVHHESSSSSGELKSVTSTPKPEPCSTVPRPHPSKLRVEDVWNKNIESSPPPFSDLPKVVGFIPKLPPLPHQVPPAPASPSTSVSSLNSYPGFSNFYVQKPVFQHDGLKNFPRMGKAPVWVSPLVARRKINSSAGINSSTSTITSTSVSVSETQKGFKSTCSSQEGRKTSLTSTIHNDFTLDRFLENRNLAAAITSIGGSTSKYTIGGGFPPQQQSAADGPVRLISLSRSSSFGLGRLPSTLPRMDDTDPGVESPTSSISESCHSSSQTKVCKSKSASSVLKSMSSLNIFSKVKRSENLSNNNEPNQQVKATKARWFLNKF